MNDVLSLLGLCLRAGKLVCGDDMVAEAAASGEARLILLSADAGAAIRRRTSRYRAPVIALAASSDELGWALGRRATAVCGITDSGFAAKAANKAAAADARYTEIAQLLADKNKRIQSRRGMKKPHRKTAGCKRADGVNQSTHTKRGGERA